MSIKTNSNNFNKLGYTVLYICYKSFPTKSRLNNLLYFSDILSILKNNVSITNSIYEKIDYGPSPENIWNVRRFLIDEKFLVENTYPVSVYYKLFYYKTTDKVSIEKLKKTLGNKNCSLIDKVIDTFKKDEDSKLAEWSHKFEPWKSANWYDKLNLDNLKENKELIEFFKEEKLIE